MRIGSRVEDVDCIWIGYMVRVIYIDSIMYFRYNRVEIR